MLGKLLIKARKEKKITKVSISKTADIDLGHLTHIEKGERNPSHKTLKNICMALHIPYQTIAYTYDRNITQDQERYKLIEHISYDHVPLVECISDFVLCPETISNASFALKVPDDSMEPLLSKDSTVFLELNANLNTKDIGLFLFDHKILLRRFIVRKDKLSLRAENKLYKDINFDENSNFTIIGRILFEKK